WASWCDPCNQEAPDLEATWKQYQAKGVRVVGVDYEDQPADAQAFVSKYGISYPSVVDRGGELATAFGVRGVPETFFIDAQFHFFAIGQGEEQGTRFGTRILGAVSRPQLKSQIDALAGDPGIPQVTPPAVAGPPVDEPQAPEWPKPPSTRAARKPAVVPAKGPTAEAAARREEAKTAARERRIEAQKRQKAAERKRRVRNWAIYGGMAAAVVVLIVLGVVSSQHS